MSPGSSCCLQARNGLSQEALAHEHDMLLGVLLGV